MVTLHSYVHTSDDVRYCSGTAGEAPKEGEEEEVSLTEEDKRWVSGRMEEQTDHLVEKMRDMQTEILRAFEVWSGGQTIRLRKLEADHSNLDAAMSGRMEVLEHRLFEIEKRLQREEL